MSIKKSLIVTGVMLMAFAVFPARSPSGSEIFSRQDRRSTAAPVLSLRARWHAGADIRGYGTCVSTT